MDKIIKINMEGIINNLWSTKIEDLVRYTKAYNIENSSLRKKDLISSLINNDTLLSHLGMKYGATEMKFQYTETEEFVSREEFKEKLQNYIEFLETIEMIENITNKKLLFVGSLQDLKKLLGED